MKNLDQSQLYRLNNALKDRNIYFIKSKIELLDHVASLIEVKMDQEEKFESALNNVLNSYSDLELQILNEATFNRSQSRLNKSNALVKIGLITGLSLCIWIFIEYITAVYFGVVELGAIYGLLSMVILLIAMLFGTNVLKRNSLSNQIKFKKIFNYNFKISLVSAGIVFVFMLFYIGLLNTELYGLSENGNPLENNVIPVAIIVSMGIGVVSEGLLIAFFIALGKGKVLHSLFNKA